MKNIIAEKSAIVMPSNKKYNLHISPLVSAREQLLIKKVGKQMMATTPKYIATK